MSAASENDGFEMTSAGDSPIVAGPPPDALAEAVMAHVLFIDIVGSSQLVTDHQPQLVLRLQRLVQATDEFQQARTCGDLVSLPTGDGMALVFFKSPEQPAGCAVDIARALRKDPFCQVRMGLHSGLVFLIQDINGARNVSGAGINQAERVMSCGRGGHIALSETIAHTLRQMARWKGCLHDAGICRVKDGTLHVWSLYDSEAGNPASLPRRVRVWGPRRLMILVLALAALGFGLWVAVSDYRRLQTGKLQADLRKQITAYDDILNQYATEMRDLREKINHSARNSRGGE